MRKLAATLFTLALLTVTAARADDDDDSDASDDSSETSADGSALGWTLGIGYQLTPHFILGPPNARGNTYIGHTLRLMDGTGLLLAGLGTGANQWRAEQEAAAAAMNNGLGYGEASYDVLGPAMGSMTVLDVTWAQNDLGQTGWLMAARVGLWGLSLEDIGALSFNIGFRFHFFDAFTNINMPLGVSFSRVLPFNTAVGVYGELDPVIDLIQTVLISQPQFTWIVGGRFNYAPFSWLLLGVESEYQSLPDTDNSITKAQWHTKAGATFIVHL